MRALCAALVVLVLAMRVLVPSGFMPMQTARGVVITLCTGQGAVSVIVDRDKAPGAPQQPKSQPGEHCAFAGGGSVPLLTQAALSAALPAWIVATGPIAFALRTGWIARLAAPPPPSLGPPAAA